MDLGLKGRKALVTGASKGIGFAVAKVLAEEGSKVALVARSEPALRVAKEELTKSVAKAQVRIFALDLTRLDSYELLSRECPDTDILVNNAGSIPAGTLEATSDEQWREGWELKVFGYINLIRQFYRLMTGRGNGVIINIIGNRSERPDAAAISGSAGNAALMALTKALGSESPNNGIRVVGVNPGWVATERIVLSLRKRAGDQLGDPERWQELLKNLPFGRTATPEEIAYAVAFLASDRSAYTSGTVLTVDGGLCNRGSV